VTCAAMRARPTRKGRGASTAKDHRAAAAAASAADDDDDDVMMRPSIHPLVVRIPLLTHLLHTVWHHVFFRS